MILLFLFRYDKPLIFGELHRSNKNAKIDYIYHIESKTSVYLTRRFLAFYFKLVFNFFGIYAKPITTSDNYIDVCGRDLFNFELFLFNSDYMKKYF